MDVSDGFSPAGISSLTLSCQHRAFAAAEELAKHQDTPVLDDALKPLAEQVEQLGQLATFIQFSLDAHTALTPRLQSCLNQYLGSCDPALSALAKQLMRLQPDMLDDVNWHFLNSQHALLKAFNDLLSYLEEMLRVEERDGQDASLNAPRGRFLMEQADRMIQTATSTSSILLSGGLEPPPEQDTPAYTPPSDSKAPAMLEAEAPPPYEPPPPSEPLPPPVPEKNMLSPSPSEHLITTGESTPRTPNSVHSGQSPSEESFSPPSSSKASSSQAGPSSGSPWEKSSLSSLTRSFKALTSSLRSKPDPLVSALCQATTNGDAQQIAGLLKHGANINGRDENGDSPLHCAIHANQGQAAEVLLAAGADVTGGGWNKMPPLFFAASLGSLDVAQAILMKGARVDQRNTSGQPYFVDVVSGGNMAGIKFLLESGANANVSSISGRPVIVLAAKKNNFELVKLLISFGAKVNVTDMTGSSLLFVAAEKGDLALVELLLEHGADPNGRSLNGVTVLIEAINKGKADLAISLIRKGADPNAWDLTGQAAIVPAVKDTKAPTAQKLELVRALLQAGADVHATTVGWSTPCIWLAVENGNLDLVDLLLRNGAEPSALRQDVTLLVHAVEKGEGKLARLLLHSGADPNFADKKGRTPLIMAMTKQNVEMVNLLMQYKVDTSVVDKAAPGELSKAMANPQIAAALGRELQNPQPPSPMMPRRLTKSHSSD